MTNLPDKGKIRQDYEAELERQRRKEDFMHRLAIGFNKWIFSKINE